MNKFFFRILVFYFSFFVSISFSQEIKKGEVYRYARKVVDTMASESMHGRGYVNNGDKIAANYIKTEFQKFGLKSFTENYYQQFNFSVNTFPEKVYFRMNESNQNFDTIKWIAGKNYLIGSATKRISKNFNTVYFDSSYASSEQKFIDFNKRKDLREKFIIVDKRKVKDAGKRNLNEKIENNFFDASGIIEVVDKLTWEPSQKHNQYPYIQILDEGKNYSKNYRGYIEVENKFIPTYHSQNIIGYVKGTTYPDSFIVFSAHYDHLGQMGNNVYFPGANDNASGCAMLLNLAKYYSSPDHQPKCSIAFIAFAAEEVGLLGSKYYNEHPLFSLKNIKFLLNMDIMGTGEDGVTIVNGTLFKSEFELLKKINSENNFVKDVKIRGKAANSDHYYFSENGVKSFFMYTMGGIKAYHDIDDKAETLPLNEFENIFQLITKFENYLEH